MRPINRPITRDTGVIYQRTHLVVRVAREGIYIKGARQRWSGAALVDWASLASVGWKLKARAIREERKQRRAARRLAVVA